MRQLKVFPTWQSVTEDGLKGAVSVVIDVFRASNTIITALSNGAKKILPVTEVRSAWGLKDKHLEYLLGGERNSIKIEGFDFGNSPLEYTREKVEGKTIILTTSNGSNALNKAKSAQAVLIASFANCLALTQRLSGLSADLAIICAGTLNTPSLEDTLAAGQIIENLDKSGNFTYNDYAYIARGCYKEYSGKILETVLKSRNGQRLQHLGLFKDIYHCIQDNSTDKIPEYNGKEIL
jgi:2-phosphosulfolactate phosphatase